MKPLRDTGVLMASVTSQGPGHVESIDQSTLTYGTNLHYAPIHQYGGTITPKKGRALAIPVTTEAMRAGSPRNMPGLIMIWKKGSRSGGLYRRSGAKGKGELKQQFLLVPKVTIPARPFLGWNNEMAELCVRILGEFWEQQVGGGGGNRTAS